LNKSLFSVLAVLSAGLALAVLSGCPAEEKGGGSTHDLWGYASPISAINKAFDEGATIVYLVDDVPFEATDDPLFVPDGKTLDLKGYKITTPGSVSGIIVADGTIKWDTEDNLNPITLENASYLIGDGEFVKSDKVGTAGTPVKIPDSGSAVVIGTQALGPIIATKNPAGPEIDALAAGSTGFILGDFTVKTPIGGQLYVKGNLTLSDTGTLSNTGTLSVYGKLESSVGSESIGSNKLVAGEVKARSIVVNGGGIFGGTVTLTSTAASTLGGTKTTFTGGLSGLGALTINGDVEFGLDSQVSSLTIGGKANLTGGKNLTVANATINNELAVAGTLTTNGLVKFGTGDSPALVLNENGGLVIAGANGKLETTGYTLTGAGSILNTSAGGTIIKLDASKIASGTTATGLAGDTPKLVFGGETLLAYTGDAEINTPLNLDLTGGGSITVSGESKTLTIAGGGSITTAADIVEGTESTGNLYIVTNSAGKLLGGTYGIDGGGSVGAGSYGTLTNNFIHGGIYILKSGTSSAFGLLEASQSLDGINGDSAGGSLVVFTEK
jgi:hypothetical protein